MLSVPQVPHLLNEDNVASHQIVVDCEKCFELWWHTKQVLNAGFSYLNFPKFEVHVFNHEPEL